MEEILMALKEGKTLISFNKPWIVRLSNLYPILVTEYYDYFYPIVSNSNLLKEFYKSNFNVKICNLLIEVE